MHGTDSTTRRARLRSAVASMVCAALAMFALLSTSQARAAPPAELTAFGPTLASGALEVLEDPTGRLTLDDVRARGGFRPAPSDAPNFGFSDAVFWFRLPVHNGAPTEQFLVELAYPHLDEVWLYAVDERGEVTGAHGGDTLPFRRRAIAQANLNFDLHVAKGATKTLYLRVTSLGSVQLPLRIWSARSFTEAKLNETARLFLYYGIIVVMILYNVFLYVGFRDPNYLYYVCYLLSFGLYQLTLNGLGYQYLWPDAPALQNRIIVPLGLSIGVFLTTFSRRFLDARKNIPRLDRVLRATVLWFALLLPLTLVLSPRLNLKLMTASAFGASLFVPICGVVCLRQGYRPARFFVLAFMAFFVGVTTAVAQSFGAVRASALSFDTMQVGSAVEVILLSLALADRIKTEQAAYQGHVERLNQALIEKERARTAFFHNTSHELRTPLNGILAFVDLLSKGHYGAVSDRARSQLLKVSNLGRSLLSQVNAILDLAKSRTGQMQLTPAPLALAELVDEARVLAEGLTLKDARRSFSLETQFGESAAPTFVSDREKLATILRNLLGNAFKFADETRPNHVCLRLALSQARELVLTVSDTGIGIAEADQPRVFEEFAQLGETGARRPYEGTGLGLALVARIVELMGGRIELTSRLGEGTTFRVRLPELRATAQVVLSVPHAPDRAPPTTFSSRPPATRERTRPAAPANTNAQRARILVVDDNEINAEVVRDVLSVHGYTIEHVTRGDLALARMQKAAPDLVLLDLMMPGMSGEDVLAAMKATPALRNVPVLVLTARASDEDRVMALELGADDYLAKPLLGEELVLRVHNTLARLDLVKAVAERRAIEQSLSTAQKVLAALGREGALVPDVALAAHYQSAEAASGDWYGVSYDANRRRLFTLIGDVTGHGMVSALVTVAAGGAAKGCLSALRDVGHDLDMASCLRILGRAVNQAVRDAAEGEGRTMTMALLCVDLSTGEGAYLNAGHTEVYVRREGEVSVLLEPGQPLGAAVEPEGGAQTFQLGAGDALLLYTDGLLENAGPDGKALGRRALTRLFARAAAPDDLKTELLSACQRIWRDRPLEDDCAFLMLQRSEIEQRERSVG